MRTPRGKRKTMGEAEYLKNLQARGDRQVEEAVGALLRKQAAATEAAPQQL